MWQIDDVRHEDPLSVEDDRPILPWRLVAGAFLHFVVPFYLIAILVDLMLGTPHEDTEAMAHHALLVTPPLLGGYVAVAALATIIAALADPTLRSWRARRQAGEPGVAVIRSERRASEAMSRGTMLFGPRGDAALARLATARWDHTDLRQQALSRDLIEAVTASVAALSTAPMERRTAIADMAAATFEHIAFAQAELAASRALEDERKAQVIAGYVETRYGPSDFSSGAD